MKRRLFPRAVIPALALCLLAAAMLVSPAASGQNERRAVQDISQLLESFDRLNLDPAELLKGARSSGRVTLQTSRGTFDLEVEPFDIRSDDYRSVAAGEGGVMTELPRTPSRSWRGKVSGAEGTQVRLVLDGAKFAGIIVTPSDTFFVEPARSLSSAAGAGEFVFYSESSVKAPGGECGTTLAEQVGVEAARHGLNQSRVKSSDPVAGEAFGPKPETQIATEADFEYFSSFGPGASVAQVNADILDIFTQVDAIYEAQLGIHIHIVFQRVWTSNTDPYTLTTATPALNEFRLAYNQSFTNAGQAAPARDLTHMFTGKTFLNAQGNPSGTIGIAYISVACISPANSYGISQSKFSTSTARRVAVTAHELGHNFGASHPNQDIPVPPGCDPSIMNSFVQDTQSFCQYSRDQITNHVLDFGSLCLTRLIQPGCTYTLTTGNPVFVGAGGGLIPVGVATSQTNCEWGIAEGVDWIDAPFNAVGSGSGSFPVAANTNSGPRETTMDVAGREVIVRQAAAPNCLGPQITPGQSIPAALAPTDCRTGRVGHPLAPVDLYTFTARAGQRVRIEMLAAVKASDTPSTAEPPAEALDCYLYLFGPDGAVIAENDDRTSNPHSTDAAIPNTGFIALPSTGVYTVAATSFENNDDGAYTLVFADNSAANFVTLSSATYSVNEGMGGGGIGSDGTGFRVVTVTRSGDTTGTATVDYATSDSTASKQSDYTQALGTLVFGPGETSKTFTVFVVDDNFQEGTESAQITLSNPVGTTLGATQTASLVINSEDVASGPSLVRGETFGLNFFVRQQYLDFFSRDPDAPGFDFWRNEIQSCGPDAACREVKRINVSAAFFLSIEFQETGFLAYRAYKAAYGDATSPGVPGTVPVIRLNEFLPDSQRIGRGVVVGAPNWEQLLEANKRAYALEFVLRPRFITAYPLSMTPAQFVDKLNQNAGFVLTQEQRDALVAQLNTSGDATAARASVLRQVADNATLRQAELNRAFVLMQYYGYLRRNPDDAPEPGLNFGGWNFWLGKLNEFNGNYVSAEMVKAFITSFEYIDRFGNRQ
ncbi:MAG: zinc-dependent metalloprotease family protein [Pyrinomonadaceae bacterium]